MENWSSQVQVWRRHPLFLPMTLFHTPTVMRQCIYSTLSVLLFLTRCIRSRRKSCCLQARLLSLLRSAVMSSCRSRMHFCLNIALFVLNMGYNLVSTGRLVYNRIFSFFRHFDFCVRSEAYGFVLSTGLCNTKTGIYMFPEPQSQVSPDRAFIASASD